MYKKNYLTVLLLFLFTIFSSGQDNTSSPYSRYGVGELADISGTQSRAMGGFSIGLRDPISLNMSNPAAISSMDTSNRYGAPFILEFGLQSKMTELKSSSATTTINNTNINYLAFAFPIIRNLWYSSFYLTPYSNVGYNIQLSEKLNQIGNIDSYYHGSGGLNRLGMGHSIKFAKHFSVGANANYIFGYLKQTNSVIFTDDSSNNFNYQIEYLTHAADLYYNFGIQYFNSFNDRKERSHEIVVGVVFDNAAKINATRDVFSGTTNGGIIDNIDFNNIIDTTLYETNKKGTIGLPQSFGIGASYTYNNKLTLGIDYFQQNWSKTKIFGASDSLANTNKIAFGLQYIPNAMNTMNGFNNYLKRTKYRFGAYYSNTYLNFQEKGEQLSDFGISFGFGLPIKRGKSSINLYFNLGQKGTTQKNLIKESYGIVGININLYDVWFVKRKFD